MTVPSGITLDPIGVEGRSLLIDAPDAVWETGDSPVEEATPPYWAKSPEWWWRKRSVLSVNDWERFDAPGPLTLVGANPDAGHGSDWNDNRYEFQHGLWADRIGGFTIRDWTARNIWGDGFYFRRSAGWLHRPVIRVAGRQGIAIVSGGPYVITDPDIADIGRSAIDLEPLKGNRVDGVTIKGGSCHEFDGSWVAAVSGSPVNDVTISDMTADVLKLRCGSDGGERRTNWTIENNSATEAFDAGGGSPGVMKFENVDGLTVRGNVQPVTWRGPDRCRTAVTVIGCTGVNDIAAENDFPLYDRAGELIGQADVVYLDREAP